MAFNTPLQNKEEKLAKNFKSEIDKAKPSDIFSHQDYIMFLTKNTKPLSSDDNICLKCRKNLINMVKTNYYPY